MGFNHTFSQAFTCLFRADAPAGDGQGFYSPKFLEKNMAGKL